jgi:ATP-dependent HslUV protease ATP-binding subunit HslU
MAEISWEANEKTENIGARRLHTVIERLLEDVSFRATELGGQTIIVDATYVNQQLNDLLQDEDLRRFIL